MEIDEARASWIKNVYGEDHTDSNLYDMVLNLESFSIPEACEVLFTAVSRPEFEMTPDRMKELKDFDWSARSAWRFWRTWGPKPWTWMPRSRTAWPWSQGKLPC